MSSIRHTALYVTPPVITTVNVSATLHGTSESTISPHLTASSGLFLENTSNLTAQATKFQTAKLGIVAAVVNQTGIAQVNRDAPELSPDCAIVFPYNRWNLSGHGSITPSTEVATYPATNTYLQQRSKVWRSTSATASLTRDLGNPYRINSICIVSHNMTKDGTFRVRISNSSTFATTLYDSGTLRIWEPSFATSGLYEEEADGSGYPTNELIELLRYCGENPRVVRWIVFDEVAARYVKIDFEDPTNSRSLIEVAYIYCGLAVRVTPDQVYGWTITPVGVSRIKKSASGSPWIDIMYRQVIAQANFASHPEASTIAFWSFLAGYLGRKKEMIVAFQPDNLPKKFFFTLFGRFKEVPQMENIALRTYNVGLELEELVG